MSRRLQDMTLEELRELFPIVLTPHNPEWEIFLNELLEAELNGGEDAAVA